MKVTTLGTGSPLPDPLRAGPASLVQTNGQNLLFDCGRGVLMRLAAVGIPTPAFLHHTFLTHLHSDHVTDFNDLVTSSWALSIGPNPLRVTGPVGTQRLADTTLTMLRDDIGYRLDHHEDLTWQPAIEVTEVTPSEPTADSELAIVWQQGDVTIRCAPTDHRPVHPTVGYRIEAEGKVVVIAGDTIPCAGVDALCDRADVYVQTAIRDDIINTLPFQRLKDVVDYHSTVTQAAQTAQRCGVKHLVLTHPVPAPQPGQEHEWVEIAGRDFDGEIVLAHDLWSVDL